MYQRCTAFFFGCTTFPKYTYEDDRNCTAFEENVPFGRNTIVNEIKSQGQCTKDVQLFSLVLQLFKNIYMRTTEFVQLWKKLYILVQTQL